MDTNTETLISQNPRDSLILRRKSNLAARDETKLRKKLADAKNYYDRELRSFASEYLAVNDENVFDSLSPQEKNALSQIYKSTCRFRLIRHTTIFTAIFGSLTASGIILSTGLFVLVGFFGFVYSMLHLWDFPISYIKFLKAKRILEKIKRAK